MSSDTLSQFEIGLKSLANPTNKNSIQMNQIYINKINNIYTKKNKQIKKTERQSKSQNKSQ